MESIKTSLTDQPRKAPEDKDNFDISRYEKGLAEFIKGAATPLTIALQGEWGSGKTSLMNSLKHILCSDTNALFTSIWINTWEYALMTDPEVTLTQILAQITSQIVKETSGENEVLNSVKNGLVKFLKVATKTGAAIIGNGDSSVVDDLFDGGEKSTLGELRDQLDNIIKGYIDKSGKRGLIFFIDDLDRITPTAAVQLMELMKNLFTLEHCIFILAIDYDVVVKGLKPKFGELTDRNEHEFRSFFDKIIQVPFSMPITQYDVSTFIIDKLSEIGYFPVPTAIEEIKGDILDVIAKSVGSNPRSIKRLINSTSLVRCIYGDKTELASHENRFLIFVFIALQVVYPKFYLLLNSTPDFTSWGEPEFLMRQNIKPLDESEINELRNHNFELVDELWEMAIKKICDGESFLKRNFFNISKIFNIIREHTKMAEDTPGKSENHGVAHPQINVDLIESILKFSATTNTQASPTNERKYMPDDILSRIYQGMQSSINVRCESRTSHKWTFSAARSNALKFEISIKPSGCLYQLTLAFVDPLFTTVESTTLINSSFVDKSSKKLKDISEEMSKYRRILSTATHQITGCEVSRVKEFKVENGGTRLQLSTVTYTAADLKSLKNKVVIECIINTIRATITLYNNIDNILSPSDA